MKPNLILANPSAGRGRGAQVLSETLGYLDNQRVRYTVVAASSLRAALDDLMGKNHSDYERLLVIGGDGMLHHAINAIYAEDLSTKLPIGLVPAGTGNDFARALGLDIKNPVRNIDTYMSSSPNLVDLGLVNGRFFGAICSTGFDSLVNERANQMSWPKGRRKYEIAMLQELPRFKPRTYEIEVDGRSFEVRAMLIAVANGPSYGGGMKVCPEASLQDGLLDVMILHPVPKNEFIRIFPKVYKGAHVTHPQVQLMRGRDIHIRGDAITYADGERIAPTPVSISVKQSMLRTWLING